MLTQMGLLARIREDQAEQDADPGIVNSVEYH